MVKIKLFDILEDSALVESYLNCRQKSYKHEERRESEWFKWKFYNSPNGQAIMPVAIEGDKVVGSNAYGLYPIMKKDIIYKAIMPYDVFVDDHYQGQGLFKRLLDLAERESLKRGIQILLAFPNSKSLKGFMSKEWTFVPNAISYWIFPFFKISLFFRILDLRKAFIPNKATGMNNFKFQDINYSFYEDVFHGMWSKDYLRWRFCDYPQAEYHHIVFDHLDCLVRVGNRGRLREGQILYLNSQLPAIEGIGFRGLINKIRTSIPLEIVSFPMSQDYPLYSQMRVSGFYQLKSRTNFVYKVVDASHGEQPVKFSLCGLDFHTY